MAEQIFKRPQNEADLMKEIMVALSEHGHHVFRANVGVGKTQDGRYFSTGLPKGFSDLFGTVKGTGQAFFVEVKFGTNTPSFPQGNFLARMSMAGCRAGVAYSIEDALQIVEGDQVPYFGEDVSDLHKEWEDSKAWTALFMWSSLYDEHLFKTLRKLRGRGCRLVEDEKWGYKITPPDGYEEYKTVTAGLKPYVKPLADRLFNIKAMGPCV